MERAGGIKKGGGGDRLADAPEKRLDRRPVPAKQFRHPFGAGEILVRAAIMHGAGDDERGALAAGSPQGVCSRRADEKARGHEQVGVAATDKPARPSGRALDGPASGKRERGGGNRGVAQVEPRHRPAVGFTHQDEVRLAGAALECLRDIQHGINSDGPAV